MEAVPGNIALLRKLVRAHCATLQRIEHISLANIGIEIMAFVSLVLLVLIRQSQSVMNFTIMSTISFEVWFQSPVNEPHLSEDTTIYISTEICP
jgi:hypothetical protein